MPVRRPMNVLKPSEALDPQWLTDLKLFCWFSLLKKTKPKKVKLFLVVKMRDLVKAIIQNSSQRGEAAKVWLPCRLVPLPSACVLLNVCLC